jgi:peptidoglycan/LPS O-acetylase OafA/YrhL
MHTRAPRARSRGGELVRYLAWLVAVTAVFAVFAWIGDDGDWVRWMNAVMAGFLSVLICIALRRHRNDIDPPRRAMWWGCAALAFGIAYGRIEDQFLQTQFRVLIVTFGLGLLIIGFMGMLDDHVERARRKP